MELTKEDLDLIARGTLLTFDIYDLNPLDVAIGRNADDTATACVHYGPCCHVATWARNPLRLIGAESAVRDAMDNWIPA